MGHWQSVLLLLLVSVGVGCQAGGTESVRTPAEGGSSANPEWRSGGAGGHAGTDDGVEVVGGAGANGVGAQPVEGHGATSPTPGVGPGLPNEAYAESELFEPLAVLRSVDGEGDKRGHGSATMYNGYLVTIWGRDGGIDGGGFDFWDISDPKNPLKVVTREDSEIREAHGWGVSRDGAGEYVVLQTTSGIQLWDWRDPSNPTKLSSLVLPGVEESDYASGAWWTFSQGHYVYVGGSGNGIYVVDVKNPAEPTLLRQVPTSEAGAFKVGPVFAVGNLLVASSMDGFGYATFDISEAARPTLLWSTTALRETYSSLFNGNRIFGAGDDGRLYILSVDPNTGAIAEVSRSEAAGSRGGYVMLQSGFAFFGGSDRCTKIDYRTETSPILVGRASSEIESRDEDFCNVIGNLALAGDDHGRGSALFAHAAEPDTTAPVVTMVSPEAGSVNRALTTRVGLTFSEEVDLPSLTSDSFSVRPAGGAAIGGRFSTQTGIVNFSPDEPLLPNTTYEVVVPAGGVRDLSGNATSETFTASFATGEALAGGQLYCRVLTAPVPVGEAAPMAASATGGGDGRITYSYDFGDDSPNTEFSTARTASHAYASVGHFSVIVTARRGNEQTTCSGVQAVYLPPSTTAPTASSTILFEATHDRVWVVNPDANTVTAIDTASQEMAFEVAVGEHPRTLALAPDGTIWVANQHSASVSVLDGANGELVATLELPRGSKPYGVAFTPDGSAGYVTLEGKGELVAFDPIARSVTGTLPVTDKPRGLAISADSSRILVTRFLSPDSGGEVIEVSTNPFEVTRTFDLAVDSGPDTEASGRGLPNYLSSLVIAPDGRTAWLPSDKANLQRGLVRDGEPLTFESTVRTIVSQLDLETNQELPEQRLDLNDRSLAQSLAFSKYGDWVFVASLGTNALDVFDAYSGAHVGGVSSVGLAPSGLVFSPDFTRLYVHGFLSRDVVVLDVAGFVTSASTAVTRVATVNTVAEETLSRKELLGKRLFYNADSSRMNRDSYLTCASCHLDGESDGRTWDFTQRGEGLRNTIPLVGRGGMDHGRLHWTGNFDEIQDFEQDIRTEMGGRGFMKDRDFEARTRSEALGTKKAGVNENLDALAAYVSSLDRVDPSPFRNPDGSLTSEAEAGALIYAELGCASCHTGPDFTDSADGALHDGFDTPTLRGVWATAPYLHDGSAPTLRDVLTSANAVEKHGEISGLGEAELDALVAYLRQIE